MDERSELDRLREEHERLRVEIEEHRSERTILAKDAIHLLETLHQSWNKYSGKTASIDDKREALCSAIVSVNQYLRFWDPSAPTGMLSDVALALADAKNGISNPLFLPEQGRKGVPLPVETNRVGAAVAMDCLMKGGLSKDEAARKIARWTGWDKGALRAWRDKISERPELVRALYDEHLAEAMKSGKALGGSSEAWCELAKASLHVLTKNFK